MLHAVGLDAYGANQKLPLDWSSAWFVLMMVLWWQRMAFCNTYLIAAVYAAIDSRVWCGVTWRVVLVKVRMLRLLNMG